MLSGIKTTEFFLVINKRITVQIFKFTVKLWVLNKEFNVKNDGKFIYFILVALYSNSVVYIATNLKMIKESVYLANYKIHV